MAMVQTVAIDDGGIDQSLTYQFCVSVYQDTQ